MGSYSEIDKCIKAAIANNDINAKATVKYQSKTGGVKEANLA